MAFLKITFVVLLICLHGVHSAPTTAVEGGGCSVPVCRRDSGFKYARGLEYVYAFESGTETSLVPTTDEVRHIKVKGTAVLEAISPCSFSLTLHHLTIEGESGEVKADMAGAEGSVVAFNWDGGEVTDVCLSPSDPTWSANLKRGLISMLYNEVILDRNLQTIEVDVSGKCRTTYKIEGTNKYTKIRNLNKCTEREGGGSTFLGIPYNTPSGAEFSESPFMDSSMECVQLLSDGVYQSVECSEIHKIRPMSAGEAGGKTVLKSSIKLQKTQASSSNRQTPGLVKSTISYDFSEETRKGSYTASLEILNRMCVELKDGSTKLPGLFLRLKDRVSRAKKDDLVKLHSDTKKMCRGMSEKIEKMFLEATAVSYGSNANAFMADLLEGDNLHDEDIKSNFLILTTFSPNPSRVTLRAMKNLAEKKHEKKVILAASGVGHEFCKKNSDCGEVEEYIQLVNIIAGYIGSGEDDMSLSAIQALGNMDVLTPFAVEKIERVIERKERSLVRMRALEAFRRDPCQQRGKDIAMKVFQDKKEGAEMRIQGYLAVMRCLQQNDVKNIQRVLEIEESNQVGSFVSSHIDNIADSSSQWKRGLKTMARQLRLKRSYSSDPRKFSRNYEGSYFSKTKNLGMSGEGNLIFSEDSFIPRFASANFTVDVWGRSYNAFEIGTYLHGFEDLATNYLKEKESMTTPISSSWRSIREEVKRNRRSPSHSLLSSQIEHFHNEVAAHKSRHPVDAEGDLYIRVFGTSVLSETYERLAGEDYFAESSIAGFNDKVDLMKPIVFLDEDLVVPTIAGLPLSLKLQGSSVFSLHVEGNLFTGEQKKGKSEGKLIPSAATLLLAKMSTTVGPVESGMQVEGKIATSSGITLSLTRETGNFEIMVGLPQEKMQLIDVRSELYWVETSGEGVEAKSPLRYKTSPIQRMNNVCTDKPNQAIGLKLCLDLHVPGGNKEKLPSFPFDGPHVLSVAMEKVENSMEGFSFKLKHQIEGKEKFFNAELDTPGSKTQRKISLKSSYIAESTNPKINFDLESPWKKAKVEYERIYTKLTQGIEIKIHEEQSTWGGKAMLKKTGSKYEPIIEYSFPNGPVKTLLDGNVMIEPDRKVDIDLRVGVLNHRCTRSSWCIGTTLKGTLGIENTANELNYNLQKGEIVSDKFGTLNLKSKFTSKSLEDLRALGLSFVGNYGAKSEHRLAFNGNWKRDDKTEVVGIKMESTRRPSLNFDVQFEGKKLNEESCEMKLLVSQGLQKSKMDLNAQTKYYYGGKEFDFQNALKITYPEGRVDFSLKADVKNNGGKRIADIQVKAMPDFEAKFDFDNAGKEWYEYSARGNLRYKETQLEGSEISKELSPGHYNYKTKLSMTPGHHVDIDTDFISINEPNKITKELRSKIVSSALNNPMSFSTAFLKKGSDVEAALFLEAEGSKLVDIKSEIKREKNNPIIGGGKIKAFVKNWFEGTADYNEARNERKLVVDGTWVPSQRQVKGASLISWKDGENYNMDASVNWDAKKNPNAQIKLKSSNNLSRPGYSINSKNEIKFMLESYKINVVGKTPTDFFKGETYADIAFIGSSGSPTTILLRTNFDQKLRKIGWENEVKVQSPGSSPLHIKWINGASDVDWASSLFDLSSEFSLTAPNKEDLQWKGIIRSTTPGNYRTLAIGFDASGSLVKEPVGFDAHLEMKSRSYTVEGNVHHGTRQGGAKVSVDFDKWSPKKEYAIAFKITTPFEAVSNLDGSYKIAYIFNSNTNFDVHEVCTIKINDGEQVKMESSAKMLENELDFKTEGHVGSEKLYTLGGNGRAEKGRFFGSLFGIVEGKENRLNVEYERQYPKMTFKIGGLSQFKNWETFQFKTSLQAVPGSQSYIFDINGKGGGHKLSMQNALENSPARKNLEIVLSVDRQPLRRFFVSLTEDEKGAWGAEGVVKWGDGGNWLSTKGTFLRSYPDLLDANLSLNSDALNVDNWNVRVSKKLTNGRQSVAFSVEGSAQKLFSLSLDYATKIESAGLEKYDGSVKVEAPSAKITMSGNFRLDSTVLTMSRNGEEGRAVVAAFTFNSESLPMAFDLDTKWTDKAKMFEIKFCDEQRTVCKNTEISFQHLNSAVERSGGKTNLKVRILTKGVNEHDVKADGIEFTSVGDRLNFDHKISFVIGTEKSRQVGARISGTKDQSATIALILPERDIVLEVNGDGYENFNAAFWLDKSRKPERKLKLSWNLESLNVDGSRGKQMALVFKHPDFKREMALKSKIQRGGDTILDLKFEIDLFNENSRILLESLIKKNSDKTGQLYTSSFAIKSKGQGLNIEGESQFSKKGEIISGNSAFKYASSQIPDSTSRLEFRFSPEEFTVRTYGSSGVTFSTENTLRESSDGYEGRYIIHLPGMRDSRIIDTHISNSGPPSASFKVYTSKSSTGDLYEGEIGFPDDRHFTIGLYGPSRSTLADFTVALNSTRILTLRARWEAENLKNAITAAEIRGEETRKAVGAVLNKVVRQTSNEVSRWATATGNSFPDTSKAVKAYKRNMNELVKELETNTDTQQVLFYFDFVKFFIVENINSMTSITDDIKVFVENTSSSTMEMIESIPALLNKFAASFPRIMKEIEEGISTGIDGLAEAYTLTISVIKSGVEKLGNFGEWGGNKLPFLMDTSRGVGAWLKKGMEVTLETLREGWSMMMDAGGKLMETKFMKKLATNAAERYGSFFASFVEYLQDELEELRLVILSLLPSKEGAELAEAVFTYVEKKAKQTDVDDDAARKEIYEKLVKTLKKVADDVVTFDPKRGILLLSVPIPKGVNKLSDLGGVRVGDGWRKKAGGVSGQLEGFISSLQREGVTPSNGFALIVGSQYFKTFDGKFFHFEGLCSYLLASDFAHGKMSLVLDYYSGPRGSVEKRILVSDNEGTNLVMEGSSVLVHGSKLSLPTSVGSFNVSRKDGWTVVSGQHGMMVSCAAHTDVCVVTLPFNGRGTTMGLLGTFNHELHDDLRMPNGEIAETESSLVRSWKLDKSCEEKPITHHGVRSAPGCEKTFGRGSPLRPAFSVVDVEAYKMICQSLVNEIGYDDKKATCGAAVAYAKAAQLQGIKISPTSFC